MARIVQATSKNVEIQASASEIQAFRASDRPRKLIQGNIILLTQGQFLGAFGRTARAGQTFDIRTGTIRPTAISIEPDEFPHADRTPVSTVTPAQGALAQMGFVTTEQRAQQTQQQQFSAALQRARGQDIVGSIISPIAALEDLSQIDLTTGKKLTAVRVPKPKDEKAEELRKLGFLTPVSTVTPAQGALAQMGFVTTEQRASQTQQQQFSAALQRARGQDIVGSIISPIAAPEDLSQIDLTTGKKLTAVRVPKPKDEKAEELRKLGFLTPDEKQDFTLQQQLEVGRAAGVEQASRKFRTEFATFQETALSGAGSPFFREEPKKVRGVAPVFGEDPVGLAPTRTTKTFSVDFDKLIQDQQDALAKFQKEENIALGQRLFQGLTPDEQFFVKGRVATGPRGVEAALSGFFGDTSPGEILFEETARISKGPRLETTVADILTSPITALAIPPFIGGGFGVATEAFPAFGRFVGSGIGKVVLGGVTTAAVGTSAAEAVSLLIEGKPSAAAASILTTVGEFAGFTAGVKAGQKFGRIRFTFPRETQLRFKEKLITQKELQDILTGIKVLKKAPKTTGVFREPEDLFIGRTGGTKKTKTESVEFIREKGGTVFGTGAQETQIKDPFGIKDIDVAFKDKSSVKNIKDGLKIITGDKIKFDVKTEKDLKGFLLAERFIKTPKDTKILSLREQLSRKIAGATDPVRVVKKKGKEQADVARIAQQFLRVQQEQGAILTATQLELVTRKLPKIDFTDDIFIPSELKIRRAKGLGVIESLIDTSRIKTSFKPSELKTDFSSFSAKDPVGSFFKKSTSFKGKDPVSRFFPSTKTKPSGSRGDPVSRFFQPVKPKGKPSKFRDPVSSFFPSTLPSGRGFPSRIPPSIIPPFKPSKQPVITIPTTRKLPKRPARVKDFEDLDLRRGIKKQRQFFNVFARPQKGPNFMRINRAALTRREALDLGSFVTDTSLSATFKVRKRKKGKRALTVKQEASRRKKKLPFPTGFFGRTGSKFREFKIRKGQRVPTPGDFIEKRSFRLDTSGEIKRITLAKRVAGLRKKKPIKKGKRKSKTRPKRTGQINILNLI